MSKETSILRRVGPGLITASMVLGPGSIVASSRAGAEGGYRLLWVLVVAGVFMAVYTSMGARLGCALNVTPLTHVARRTGRWLAVLAGLSAFLVTAGFQFGNNMGVSFAATGLTGVPHWIWPIAFTTASLMFLFTAKRVYTMLERMMMALVAVMIVCFFGNLFWTGVLAVTVAFIMASAFSAILVYAQELMPGRVGLASGMFYGFSFGLGGLGAAALGRVADYTSIATVYQLCPFLLLLGLLVAFLPRQPGAVR